MYGMDSKLKLRGQLKTSEQSKSLGIYNLSSFIISRILRILASQNRFQSLYDEILNIERFLEYLVIHFIDSIIIY